MDDENFNEEVDTLIEWCEDLDYDRYMEDWQVLATSTKPEVPNASGSAPANDLMMI